MQEAEKRPNALSQFLFLDLEETSRRNTLILTYKMSRLLLSEFSKVQKEKPSRYVFIIADYRNGFRLLVQKTLMLYKSKASPLSRNNCLCSGTKEELNQKVESVEQREF